MRRVSDDLQVGIEYNPLADDIGPLANWRAVRETLRRPAVTFGTSSDRIGTPSGRAFYVTLSKDLEPLTGLKIAPFVSALYGQYEDEWVFPAGATIRIGPRWSLIPSYDGRNLHPMASYQWDRYSVTGILRNGRDPGVAFTVGF
jgi:hypothetical protein